MMSVSLALVSVLNWAHESDELAWDDPVEVTVFDSLVILVLLDVEGAEVVPAKSHGVLEALEAVEKRAVIEALPLGGISVVLEEAVIWLELLIGCLCGHLEDDDHESSHQESAIGHFVPRSIGAAVVEYPVLGVVLVSQKSCQLTSISMNHSQIEWAKILVEGEVSEIIINIEKESVLEVLWWLSVGDPIKLVCR